MAYDITAVAVCVVTLVAVLYDGRISKAESYLLLVCCLVVGATSMVTGILDGMLFSHGINAYTVCAFLLAVVIIFRKFTDKIRGYLIGACALVLGSSQAFTSWLPPMINGFFAAIGEFFGSL